MAWEKLSNKNCSRRTFMKGTAATAAAVTLVGCSKDDSDDGYVVGQAGNAPDLRKVRKVYSTCPVECLTHSLNCQLVGDEVIRVEPTKVPSDEYFTTACARGMSRMQFLTENRVTTPMKRIKRGTETSPLGVVLKNNDIDEWVSISWGQAISEIGTKLKELKDNNDPGIVLWTGSGNMGPIVNTVLGNFFGHVNPNRVAKLGNSCCAGVDAGMVPVYGTRTIDTRDTIRFSQCIINWGNNPAETSNTYWKFVVDAKRNGAKIITIDPRYSGSAEKSDMWVQVKPGTDVLFGIGMLRHIFSEDKTNKSGGREYIDTDMLMHRTNAPYLVDISAIMNGNVLKAKAYNELFNVIIKKDSEGNPLIWNGAAEVAAELNTGHNTTPDQTPDLYYTNMASDVTTVYQLMRALYAGDLLNGGENDIDSELAKLHDINYNDAYIATTTGVRDIAVINNVAKEYAGSGKKSMIIQNMGGMQRTESAGHDCAMHCILSLVTGNVGDKGNGVDDTSGWGSAASGLQTGDMVAPGATILGLLPAPKGESHEIPFGVFGRRTKAANDNQAFNTYVKKATNGEKDPVVKFWYLATSNLLTQFPNTDALKDALSSSECVVTAKPTWSTDADYSDYFLPVTTPFEYHDLGANNRNKYIQLMEAGVKPYGQARSDMQIVRDLVKIVFPDNPDLIESFNHDDEYYPKSIIENPANNMVVNGVANYDDLKAKKVVRPTAYDLPFVPLWNHEFKNDLKRAHIFIPDWNTNKYTQYINLSPNPARDLYKGPFPRYVPALQSQLEWLLEFPYVAMPGVPLDIAKDYDAIRREYPLANVQFKVLRTVHASFTGLPWIREAFGEQGIVLMHPSDAFERGIEDGDTVTVKSHSGAVERIARVTPTIMKRVTAIENGWWDKFGKVSSSTVGVELPGPLNNAHTHNNTLVEIMKGGLE